MVPIREHVRSHGAPKQAREHEGARLDGAGGRGRCAGGDQVGSAHARARVAHGREGPHERIRRQRGNRGSQSVAGAVHELADSTLGDPQRGCHLSSAAPLNRRLHQRLALAIGKASHLRKGVGDLQARLGELLGGGCLHDPRFRRRELGRPRRPGGGVAEDLMKPAAQVTDLDPRLEGCEGAEKGLLDEVLGPAIGRDPTSDSMQLTLIARHDDGKRTVVAGPDQRDEPLVRL